MKTVVLFMFFALTCMVFEENAVGQFMPSAANQELPLPTKQQILKQIPSRALSVAGTSLPLKMSYQGVLTNSGGNPVADGSYNLTIDLYDSLTNGTSQWSEAHAGASVSHGTFSVTLGETTPLNLQFNKPLFVQVVVTGGPAGPSYPITFSPRSQLLSSPYALAPWVTNGSDIYYKNGKVGLGSSAPESSGVATVKLEIADEDGLNSDVSQRVAGGGNGGGYPIYNFAKSRGALSVPTGVNQYDILGAQFFLGHDGTGFQQGAAIYGWVDSTPSPGRIPTALSFYTSNQHSLNVSTDWSEKMRLDRNGGLYIDYSNDNTGNQHPGLTFGNTSSGEGIGSNRAFQLPSPVNIWGLDFYTAYQRRMSITNAGNVGIGTPAPLSQLHVKGNNPVRILGDLSTLSGSEYVDFMARNTPFSSDIGGMRIRRDSTTGDVNMSLFAAASGFPASEKMRINGDGKIGIGTSSPTNTLSVGGTADFSGNVGIGTASPANTLSVAGSADISGNVGIGTSALLERLTIGGSMQVGDNVHPYQHLAMSGGNSLGFIYGDYTKYPDAINIGYNYTTDGAGHNVIPNTGGPTSRLSLYYGAIGMWVGGVNTEPAILGMWVDNFGNVGIGTQTPSTKLCVNGNISYSGIVAGCSDIRYKKQITTLTSSLDKVTSLRGVSYYWRTDEFPDHNFPNDKQIGLIAQEVEKVYPEVVLTDDKGYKSIDYSHLTPALIEAVKELNAKVDEIQKLRTEVNDLKALVKSLAADKKSASDRSIGELK